MCGDCGWAVAHGVKRERAVEQSVRLAGLSARDWAEVTSWAARALSEAGPRGEGSLFGLEEEVGPARLVSGFWGLGLLLFLFLFLTQTQV